MSVDNRDTHPSAPLSTLDQVGALLSAEPRPAFSFSPEIREAIRAPRFTRRDLAGTHAILLRLLERAEALDLECSVLKEEFVRVDDEHAAELGRAQTRIHELEDAVASLMDVIHQYEALLEGANSRIVDAEQRATDAEHWIRSAERGTSEAVEWLYNHVSRMLDEPR